VTDVSKPWELVSFEISMKTLRSKQGLRRLLKARLKHFFHVLLVGLRRPQYNINNKRKEKQRSKPEIV
jgi:hypothetical protein